MDDAPSQPQSSAYPSHPPPILLRLTTTPDHACSYFPDRLATTRAFWASAIEGELYHQFMDAGFRRSGKVIYQPICTACRRCIPIRVPVAKFSPDKSQRRVWRKNQDLAVSIDSPAPTEEKYHLYERYRRQWHNSADGHDYQTFTSFLYDSPVDTIEISYRGAAGKLLGVGICDLCSHSLSTVYFYFEPEESRRNLGTFSALWEIDWAKRAGIPHYYLGYWVSGCGAMEYKSTFRPCELLGTDGIWREKANGKTG